MIDVALGIEALVPSAQYYGTTIANDKECFDALNWLDDRKKPTWKEIQDAYNALPEKITNPDKFTSEAKAAILDRIGLTADELKIILG